MKILIYGEESGEHLRAEVSDAEVVLVSHELTLSRTTTNWRDRVLTTIPAHIWLAIAGLWELTE